MSEAHEMRNSRLAVLVFLYPFRRNLLLKCAQQPKIAKNLKVPILGVLGRSVSLIFIPFSSSSVVLVTISLCLPATIFTLDELTAVK